MKALEAETYRAGEVHRFEAAGQEFVYLAPAGGIFGISAAAAAVLETMGAAERRMDELRAEMRAAGFSSGDVEEALEELIQARVLERPRTLPPPRQKMPERFPLQSLVMNLTNQCNLSCKYCYEYGEDKVATPDGKPKFMEWETAKASVDYFLQDSAGRDHLHITFFGGETLMNFPLLKKVVDYAEGAAAEQGRAVDFSLTTNATLLTPALFEFLAA